MSAVSSRSRLTYRFYDDNAIAAPQLLAHIADRVDSSFSQRGKPMHRFSHSSGALRRVSAIALALSLTGCLADEPNDSVSAITAPLIGGFDATSPGLNAVGSLSLMAPGAAGAAPTFQEQCSGSLIGPRTVVTAKHCLAAMSSAGGTTSLVFAVGPDAAAPIAYAMVIDGTGAPGDDGGYTDNGHDVAVMQLDRALTDVPLVSLGAIGDADVGQEFVGVGFGKQSNNDSSTTRRLGALTLRARTGKTYEFLYGSFEAFYKAQAGTSLPSRCPASGTAPMPDDELCVLAQRLRDTYDNTLLETEDELAVGSSTGDSQPCYGDSGGPLLRTDARGALVVYGVTSGGAPSDTLICDHGAIYASFGADVTTFLTQSLTWSDPCASITTVGSCDGEHAKRCSTAAEGTRRVIEVDCSVVGLHCIMAASGATCGDLAAHAPPS